MPTKTTDKTFAKLRAAANAAKLPEVEASTSHGKSALKLRGKFMAGVKEADVLVLMCPVEEKEMLIEAEPAIYFETDHYKGWPAVLVRLPNISQAELRHRLSRAWRMRAPKRLIASLEGT